mgnify:FL=1
MESGMTFDPRFFASKLGLAALASTAAMITFAILAGSLHPASAADVVQAASSLAPLA